MSSGDETSTFCVSKYEACSIKTFCSICDQIKNLKHENAENRTKSHECKLNVQMLLTRKVFHDFFLFLIMLCLQYFLFGIRNLKYID